MGGDNLPLGGKPKGDNYKGVNVIKRNAAEARKQAGNQAPMQPQEPVDEFGDGSSISRDWRDVPMIIGSVFKQVFDICWAIALTRLLQAIYNITQKTIGDCKEFVHDDLVVHLKLKNKSVSRTTSLKLKNLKDAVKHIAKDGLLKTKSSGHAKAGSAIGFHAKWNFEIEKCPSAEFIRSKVDISPVVIALEIGANFQFIKKEIYKVRGAEMAEGEVQGHALLIVAYGYTKEGRLFFVVQNSWGDEWGVGGYGRIFIDEQSKTTLVYPEV